MSHLHWHGGRGLAGPLPSDAPEALEQLQHLVTLHRQLPSSEPVNKYSSLERAFCLMDGYKEVFDRWVERCLLSLAERSHAERRVLLENADVRDAEMALCP